MASTRDLMYAAQLRTADVLAGLLTAADDAGLPPLAWTVTTTGALVGHSLCGNDEQRRSEFEAWRKLLDVPRILEYSEDGRLALQATADDVRGCRVTVIAHLDELVNGGDR
ncbi:hypothetical protein [Allorhizocola rhizosphaerae]|uniref:hypothetical protein n=1 Tax=Allorhizocola rhizosphaerae TaxID=1872709 RepID=UPI0013C2DAA5|nr:hypothetical protein [Allorhizocola rhizosphaerae]